MQERVERSFKIFLFKLFFVQFTSMLDISLESWAYNRLSYSQRFGEIAFCAITADEQVIFLIPDP